MLVVTITSAHHYTKPICPVDEQVQCQVRCNVQVEEPICASGWQGTPITLRNRCVLLSYNCGCQSFRNEKIDKLTGGLQNLIFY